MEPVKTWIMTEEERLSYIAKHPIKLNNRLPKKCDYKWRGQKAAIKKRMVIYLKSKGFHDNTLKMLNYEQLTSLANDYHFKLDKKAQ